MALRFRTDRAQAKTTLPATIDPLLVRKCSAEFIGTAALVFFGAGVATVTFGFRAYGSSVAAGVVSTALAFALVMVALVAVIGPISGCHINPAVTLGYYLTKRIDGLDAAAYVVAQVVGAIIGALLLFWLLHASPFYLKSRDGLGANGYGKLSLLHMSAGGAFLAEVIMTAIFVFVFLGATRRDASPAIAGIVIGLTLGLMNLVGIPIDGTSVNPARSLGPAMVTGGAAFSQIWVFLLAPLLGGVLAAGLHLVYHPVAAGATGGLVTNLVPVKEPETHSDIASAERAAERPTSATTPYSTPTTMPGADPGRTTQPTAPPEGPTGGGGPGLLTQRRSPPRPQVSSSVVCRTSASRSGLTKVVRA